MRNILFLVCLLLAGCGISIPDQFVGTWYLASATTTLVFRSDGYCSLQNSTHLWEGTCDFNTSTNRMVNVNTSRTPALEANTQTTYNYTYSLSSDGNTLSLTSDDDPNTTLDYVKQ